MAENLFERILNILPRQEPHSLKQREKKIRHQLKELEFQALTVNESIGLLRAALTLSGQGEVQENERTFKLFELHSQATKPEQDLLKTALQLGQELTEEHWRHHLLHTHILRSLYQQMLELKRQSLRQKREQLLQEIHQLPEARQRLLKTMLENSLQGSLVVGVEHLEQRYHNEFQEYLLQVKSPIHQKLRKLGQTKSSELDPKQGKSSELLLEQLSKQIKETN